jgi:hypothetical protein
MAKARNAEEQHTLDLSPHRHGSARSHEPFVSGSNPKLLEFVRCHSTPYDLTTDNYEVPAFDRDLIVDKAASPKAIYDMHTYSSKNTGPLSASISVTTCPRSIIHLEWDFSWTVSLVPA